MSDTRQPATAAQTEPRNGGSLQRCVRPRLRIEYIWWAGHFSDIRHKWCAMLASGEVWDYGSLDSLTRDAKRSRLSYEVIRRHRNGKTTVIAKWPNDQKLSHAAGDCRQPEIRSENCQA